MLSQRPEDLWAIHSQSVSPKPHKRDNSSWKAIEKVCSVCYLTTDIMYDCSSNSRVKKKKKTQPTWYLYTLYIKICANLGQANISVYMIDEYYKQERCFSGPRSSSSTVKDRVMASRFESSFPVVLVINCRVTWYPTWKKLVYQRKSLFS